jgi:membrane protease YdiL (CAAX protease family)
MKLIPALDSLVVIIAFALVLLVAGALALPAAGTWAIVAGLAMAAWRLPAAGVRWTDLGWRRAGPAGRFAVAVLAPMLAVMLASALLVTPLGDALGWPPQDVSRFAALRGDAMRLAAYLLLAWVSAALGEEWLFRGVLLTRLEAAFGPGRLATLAAVVLQAGLFALGHAYLGARGVATALVVGLVFGLAYVLNGRNLVPLVLAHGLIDTLSLVAIYAGAVPADSPGG